MELRDAGPGDEDEVADVHVRSWQGGYRGLLPAAYLDALDPADRAATYDFSGVSTAPDTVLVMEAGAVIGFCACGPARGDTDGERGEVLALYVDPRRWGCGAGRLLMGEARRRLARRGFSEAVLWIMVGNLRASRFYEQDGWRLDGAGRREEVHGVTVDEVRFQRLL